MGHRGRAQGVCAPTAHGPWALQPPVLDSSQDGIWAWVGMGGYREEKVLGLGQGTV
jgi:hypothetical protein